MKLELKENTTSPYHNSHSYAQQQVLLFTQNKNIPQKVIDILEK